MEDMNSIERADSPHASLGARQPMMAEGSQVTYPTNYNGVQHVSEEYHSGYARTPVSVV